MQNKFYYTSFNSKMILSFLFLMCFQFSAFSISKKLCAKTSYKRTCIISKENVSNKTVLIKAIEQNQSDLLLKINDLDFEHFLIDKKVRILPFIYSSSSYTYSYLMSYMLYKAELISPPPRH